jgi:spermidine/putrescine transport system permease protein
MVGTSAVVLSLYAIGVYTLIYAPIVMLAIYSFNDAMFITPTWDGFTLKWYRALLENPNLHEAFRNSFTLGLATAAISTIIGVAFAFAFRKSFLAKNAMFNLMLLPMLTPGIVFGVALILFWNLLHLRPSLFGSTLVGHVTYTLPFIFLIIFPRLHKFEHQLEEAAMDLGADELTTFWEVTFPLIKPGIVASALFAFTLSFDEFIRTLFLVGSDNTLPIFLWSMIEQDISPQTNAIATVIMVFSLLWAFVGQLILTRSGGGAS